MLQRPLLCLVNTEMNIQPLSVCSPADGKSGEFVHKTFLEFQSQMAFSNKTLSGSTHLVSLKPPEAQRFQIYLRDSLLTLLKMKSSLWGFMLTVQLSGVSKDFGLLKGANNVFSNQLGIFCSFRRLGHTGQAVHCV